MSSPLHDVRHAVRLLRRNPGFAAVAVLTLALGVGMNSSMFRLLDAVPLRELPVDHPRQLVLPAVVSTEGTADDFSYPEFEAVRDQSQSLAGVFAFDTTRFLASVNGQTDYLFGQCVSNNFYSVLGVRPILGRVFLPEDNQSGQPPVAVISYKYWQKRFAGDKSVLQQSVELKKIPFRIVGVAPASFQGIESGDAIDIWIPMVYWPQVRLADHLTVGMMARLKPDVTVNHASAGLPAIDHQVVGIEAAAASRVLAGQLFGVTSTDSLTFGAVAIAMTAVALAACNFPARRAAKVDPMVALRYE